MSLQPGTALGHYQIESILGAGGMGVVYRAIDTRLDRAVAVKMLPTEFADDSDRRQRFEREARTVSQLNHPNICTLFDVGQHEGRPFIVIEVIDGETIRERLTGRPFRTSEVLELGAQLADALDAAHTQQIIHRDIKPANIFVTRRGQAKLMDFGLAKLTFERKASTATGERFDAPTVEAQQLTRPGSAVGTVAYMSPEQARGEELDQRTDLFSFGAVLYEMATGHQAFSGATTAVVFDAILNRAPVAPVQVSPDLPVKLQDIINNALEKDRDLRYQSAADVRADLKRAKRDIESGRTTSVSAVSPAIGSRVPVTAASSSVGVDLVVADSETIGVQSDAAEISDKKRLLMVLLCLLLGIFGAHRFYAGRPRTAVLQLLTLGGLTLWFVADFLIIVFGEFRAGDGKKITRWL